MSANGYLSEAELVHVSSVETLSVLTARAFRHLCIGGQAQHVTVAIASPGGGYRSFNTQDEMRRGSLGDVALARKWDLNPNSSVPLAQPGYSTHGTGTRVDLLFNGSSNPTQAHLDLCAKFGFTREFGGNDPNHFQHDGHTATQPLTADEVAHAHLYPYTDGKVPDPRRYVTVESGDSLSIIASRAGVSLATIEHLNPQITNPNSINVGDRVRVK